MNCDRCAELDTQCAVLAGPQDVLLCCAIFDLFDDAPPTELPPAGACAMVTASRVGRLLQLLQVKLGFEDDASFRFFHGPTLYAYLHACAGTTRAGERFPHGTRFIPCETGRIGFDIPRNPSPCQRCRLALSAVRYRGPIEPAETSAHPAHRSEARRRSRKDTRELTRWPTIEPREERTRGLTR